MNAGYNSERNRLPIVKRSFVVRYEGFLEPVSQDKKGKEGK